VGWAPPNGWIVLPTAVPGVQVWGPRPVDESESDAPDGGFRCGRCGGAVGFDVARGASACGFCGHVEAVAGPVGRAARADAFTDEAIARATQGWSIARRELHCDGCGVDLAVEDGDLATTCAFCGSSRVLLRDGVLNGLRPSAVLPFTVTGDALNRHLHGWLGRGWMHPPDLRRGAAVEKLAGVYLPFWNFDARARASWKAEVGTQRTRTVYRNGKSQTETYIEWRWRSGAIDRPLPDYLECGSRTLHRGLLMKAGRFDLGALAPYQPALLAGFRAQAYDVGLTEAWDAARSRMRDDVRSACERDTGSVHVRNMSVQADLDEETWRYVLLPLYIGAYRYQGRTFHVLVNGQAGTVAGHRPVVWWKVWAAVAVSFTPGALLGLLGLPLLLIGIGAIVLVIAVILLIVAGVWSFSTVREATESEGGAP
jgi:hypothetical protein